MADDQPVTSQAFPRSARVRKRKEFLRIERTGRRYSGRLYIVIAARDADNAAGAPARLGVTVSKKVGGAVTRNLVKRRIRECFRREGQQSLRELALVVIARAGAASATAAEGRAELGRLFGQARELAMTARTTSQTMAEKKRS